MHNLTGLLVDVRPLDLAGIGLVMIAGAIATALATTGAGTGIKAATGGRLCNLVGLDNPEESFSQVEDAFPQRETLWVSPVRVARG